MTDNAGTNDYCTDPTCPYQPQEHVHGPGYVRAEPEPTPAPAVPDARDEEIARLTAELDAARADLSPDPTPPPPTPSPAP